MPEEKIAICLYQNFVPNNVEGTLEQLYENIFSSLAFSMVFNPNPAPVSTYVVEKNQIPDVVLLFQIEGARLRVLNEAMPITAEEMERFAKYAFASFPAVEMVAFNAIRSKPGRMTFPAQRFNCLEDIVVSLPGTEEEYFASLSKALRKNIKRYRSKTRRELPSLEHEVLLGDEIKAQDIEAIIGLNKARMRSKQKISTYDDLETAQLTQLVRLHGFVRIIRLNGVVVAGEICSRAGNHYFFHVGAHDPAYDEYGLGILNCYLTICECIGRGGKAFHFLWGQYAYKYSFGGVQQNLDHVTLYRSRLHFFINGKKAISLGAAAAVRAIKSGAQSKAMQQGLTGRVSKTLLNIWQLLKYRVSVGALAAADISREAPSPGSAPRIIDTTSELSVSAAAYEQAYGNRDAAAEKAANSRTKKAVTADSDNSVEAPAI